MGNRYKQSVCVARSQLVHPSHSVGKRRKEPWTPNSEVTHRERWDFPGGICTLGWRGLSRLRHGFPTLQGFPATCHCPTGVDTEHLHPERAVPQNPQPRGQSFRVPGHHSDKEQGSQERPSTEYPNCSCRSPWASRMATEHQPCSTL